MCKILTVVITFFFYVSINSTFLGCDSLPQTDAFEQPTHVVVSNVHILYTCMLHACDMHGPFKLWMIYIMV